MKIAIVGPFFLPQVFGIEKVMWKHAVHLTQRGHEVHVITSAQQFPRGRFEDLPTEEMVDGFMIHRIHITLRSPSRLFFYLTNSGVLLRGLTGKLKQIEPDIVHVHNVASPAWAYIAARYTRRFRKKLFYSLHYHPDCLGMSKWHTSVLHGLNRLPLRISRRLFHLTRLDFDLFSQEYPRVDRSRYAVLPNGVDAPLAITPRTDSGDMFRLLFVGRVEDHRKGFDLLETAFAKVQQPNWQLTIVGRIGEEKREALTQRFGSAVRVLGAIKEQDLEREYAAADLFVMPSRYEGFGMPYIEAMRYGIPVIGTEVGGIPETVPEGTGLLIPPEDEGALANAMQQLSASPERRRLLGEAGRRWSERFYWDRVTDQLEAHYRQD